MFVSNKRNIGLDLFRIVMTFMICVLHILGRGGVLKSIQNTRHIYSFIETICYCAVDGYAILSGFVSETEEVKISKILKMWFQVFFYSCIVTNILELIFLKDYSFDLLIFVKKSFPIISGRFWYFVAYFPLFFFIPFINKALNNISDKNKIGLLVLIILLFSCFSIFNDYYCEDGYSFTWLFLMFVIGGIIKRLNFIKNIKNKSLFLLSCTCILTTYFTNYIFKSQIFMSYISPTIVIYAISLLLLFYRIKINSCQNMIVYFSRLTFGVYLFQCSYFVWNYVIDDSFVFIANINMFRGILLVLIGSLLIFVVGALCEIFRIKLFQLLKIDNLCIFLENLINIIIDYFYLLICNNYGK